MNLFQKKHDWIRGGFEFLRADTTVETDPGSGGALFAVDANGATLWPYAKAAFGASGTQTPVSAANPLPTVQTGTPGLPTGAATAARQDTGNTSLATLAGAVAGTELQVDVLTAPVTAVTDNGGSLTTDTPQLPATIGQKAAAASVSVILASDQALPLPSGAATETTLAALNTKTATAKTSDYDTGAGTDTVPMMGIALPGSGGAVQGGTATNPVRTDPTGTTAQPITDNGGSLTTDTPQLPAALVGGRLDTAVGAALPAGTNNIGDVDVLTLPNVNLAAGTNTNEVVGDAAHDAAAAGNPLLMGGYASAAAPADVSADADAVRSWHLRNGAIATAITAAGALIPGDATNGLDVDVTRLPGSAHDAAISGNPNRVGLRALTSEFTAVATGDTVDAQATILGKQVIFPHAIPDSWWAYAGAAGGIVTTTGITIKAAGAAGVRNYITKIVAVNSHQTISTEIVIRDGASGTVLWRCWCQAAGGGFGGEVMIRGSTATLLEVAEITTTGTAGVIFSCQGHSGAE